MYKVRAVLRGAEKDMLENMEEHIQVLRNIGPFNEDSIGNSLPVILKSIAEKKVLHIQYEAFSASEKTKRDIEAVGIFYAHGYWHTIAFCRLRNDYRDFRTDRMLQIQVTDKVFDKQHPSLKEYLEQIALKQNLEKVVILVDAEIIKYLNGSKYYYGFVSEKAVKDKIEMTFLTPSHDAFIRWYLMFADHGKIISPDSLHSLLKEHIHKVSQIISS